MTPDIPYLCAKYNYNCDTATPHGQPTVITSWRDSRPIPDWEALWALEVEENRVASLKNEAGRRILARYPDWKQRNMIAHSVKLDRIKAIRALTLAEQTAYDACEAAWAWVESVRAESDRLEADPNATPNWPE